MQALTLLKHLKSAYPRMDVSIQTYDCDGKGVEVVEFVHEGDVYTDPIELAHRGIEHDYGFPGLIESDAQLISDHNKKYNAWVCGGVLDGGQ